jgi:hypothetical protein
LYKISSPSERERERERERKDDLVDEGYAGKESQYPFDVVGNMTEVAWWRGIGWCVCQHVVLMKN